MKRAKDRWINGHLAVGLLFLSCLVLPSVSTVKATSLFRTTTTTTTSAPTESDETQDGVDPAESDGIPTKPPTNYTGIPQIDYIHDPNLPRELNGYNLSSYPFLETVPPPNEMEFKCDGLHDGFYASVPQKCQVYHQCLYGTRYDFLCANYTAFDQKTFICQFVSVVDCVNSHKYFHRNDALYVATTTSTAAPLTTTTTTTVAPPPGQGRPRGGGGRRRPINRRPRPQYDYYDDEYYPSERDGDYYEDERRSYGEGRGNRRRKRPRPRRPMYDEYEDERFDRRPSRNHGEEDEYDDRAYERPRKPSRRPSDERGRPDTRKQDDDDDDSRAYERPKKPRPLSDDRRERPRRPYKEEESRYDKKREGNSESDEKNVRDERPYREDRPMKERPLRDERPKIDDRRNRNEERSQNDNKKNNESFEATAGGGALVKPNGESIYSKPRIPPKIARPVPTNEKDKYKYVQVPSVQSSKPIEDEEYYDYEEEEPKPVSQPSSAFKNRDDQDRDRYKSKDRNRSNFERDAPKRPLSDASGKHRLRRPEVGDNKKTESADEYVYEDELEEPRPKKPATNTRERGTKYSYRKRPAKIEEDYSYEDEKPTTSSRVNNRQRPSKLKYGDDEKQFNDSDEKSKHTDISTESIQTEKGNKNGYVRVIKRPFLPSRGGSPYLPRGLKPLGGRNFNKTTTTTSSTTPSTTTAMTTSTTTTTEKPSQVDYSYETEYEIVDDKNVENPVENYSDETYSRAEDEQRFKDNRPKEAEKSQPDKPEIENKRKNQDSSDLNVNNREYEANNNNRAKPQYENVEYDNYTNPPSQKQTTPEKSKESDSIFRPSPQFTIPQKPTIKPYTPKIPENISIKQNLADSIENDYDVTINEALSPTLPNLAPVRNFPSPFASTSDRDYTFTRFRNNYQETNNPQYNNYQYRNQQASNNPFKYSTRAGSSYVKSPQPDSSVSGSDPIIVGVSVRTPQSFYIQQPRYSSTFSAEDTNAGLRSSHLIHRHVNMRDYYV